MNSSSRRAVPTVADIAREAGVAPGTVSKALNQTGQLSESTRRRVIQVADSMGYRPNLLARGLNVGRSYTVGMLTTDSIGRFTLPVLLGAEDTMDAGEMSILLADTRGDPIREQYYIRTLLARKVDGIIVTGRSSDPRSSLRPLLPVPVVYALGPSESSEDISVSHDDVDASTMATEHLLSIGRRRLVHITGPSHHVAVQHRVSGFEKAMKDYAAMPVSPPLYGQWSEVWGREATNRLKLKGVEFDGVLAGNDQIARGVASALRDQGKQVPQEVGIVGFDNWDAMIAGARPPLTSVDFNLQEIGRVAAQLLLDCISGKQVEGGTRLVRGSLIRRRSTEV